MFYQFIGIVVCTGILQSVGHVILSVYPGYGFDNRK